MQKREKKKMSVLDDNFPSMEEFFERYGDDGVQEPRDEYYMLHQEYEETYAAQFSYEFALIKDTKMNNKDHSFSFI